MKPIVSHMAEDVHKVGLVRNREEQLRFAFDGMGHSLRPEGFVIFVC